MSLKNHDFTHISNLQAIEEQYPDIESTVPENYLTAVKMYAAEKMIGYRAGLSTNTRELVDYYNHISFQQSTMYVKHITELLLENSLQKEDRCVIYAKNSPLWLLSDLAISFAGGVSVPVYDTLGLENLIYCINLVSAKFIFVGEDYIANIIGSLDRLPTLTTIISMDSIVSVDKLKQQIHKVILMGQKNGIIDDNGSLYSMGSQASQSDAETEQTQEQDFSKIDGFIDTRKYGNTKLIEYNFPQSIKENPEQGVEYLKSRLTIVNPKNAEINCVTFTSGTSGYPKGVLQSHKNVLTGVGQIAYRFVPHHINDVGEQLSMISYLPLAHVFERQMEHGMMRRGTIIYFASGAMKNLPKDLELAKPSYMIGVPRVYVKIYQTVMSKINKSPLPVRVIFKTAFNIKKAWLRSNPKRFRRPQLAVVDKIFAPIQKAFGGKLEFLVSGAAAMPENVREFLEVATGARMTLGYTMTESSGTGCFCLCGQPMNSFSQIGFASRFTDTKVIDRSDSCEFSLQADKVGELCLRGPGIAQGYINNSWGQVTKITDADNFYHTGDLVRLHSDGTASFIRRVGLVVKLQHGEFVDLEQIESALEESPLIMWAFVHGECDKTAPICFISVHSSVLQKRVGVELVEKFKQGDKKAVDEIENYFMGEGDKMVREAGLKGFNVPKAYHVALDKDWSTSAEYFTPSQKKKHGTFIAHHKTEAAEMWAKVAVRDQDKKPNKKQAGKGKEMMLLAIIILFIAFALLK
ncbi:Long_chain fatty acid CoA ligase [Hexamita inflata]|uniref:Long chain fatty acid CoA ligase n=1 Tax=Hexamita inflata TaxID=28002 RepID=A0AA86Q733_9EUKA|nr:Long chain fatty acid CoA ligase [Hexamita inflata]